MNNTFSINCRGKLMSFSAPVVMGIVNITPDSFFSGSRYQSEDAIKSRIEEIILQGGTIADLGGFSTRPGANDVSEQEELDRICRAVVAARDVSKDILISIDSFRPKVVEEAIGKLGADIINDISGGLMGEDIFKSAAKLQAPYILMHTRGTTIQEMQQKAEYDNISKDIFRFFAEKIARLREYGVNDIIIDPGFGFAKDIEQNYELLAHLDLMKSLDLPMLVGVSRKRMIRQLLDSKADDCVNGTTIINTIALQKGAHILRVHDVREAMDAIKICQKLATYEQ